MINSRERVNIIKEGDRLAELQIVAQQRTIRDDWRQAKSIQKLSTGSKAINDYLYLKLLPEEYCYAEYYCPQSQPYRIYFHKAGGHWFVYKNYLRVEQLFEKEKFDEKVFYIGTIPDDMMSRRDYDDISAYLSACLVLYGEEKRKKELQGATGGGYRLNYRTMAGRKVPKTYRAAYAREMCRGSPMLKLLIYRQRSRIVEYQKKKIEMISRNLGEKGFIRKTQNFIKRNARWVKARKEMGDYANIQHIIRQVFPTRRTNRLVVLNGVTPTDICNELLDFPAWFGYQYYPVRSCKDGITVIYDGAYIVKEDKYYRHLRVRPSIYKYKPQPTTIFNEAAVHSKHRIALDHWPVDHYPPPVNSVSGFSSASTVSTATTSPNSWYNEWKMQPRHDEYEQRYTELSAHNPNAIKARGVEEFAARYNEEVKRRADLAVVEMEILERAFHLDADLDMSTFISQNPAELTAFNWLPDFKSFQRAETYIDKIMAKKELTVEDKKNLQVLCFAKQRYEVSLGKFRKNTETSESQRPQSQILERHPLYTMMSVRANHRHLCINDAWRRFVDTNRCPPNALRILSQLISDKDAWPVDSDNSNLSLVERADHIRTSRVIDMFQRRFRPTTKIAVLLTVFTVIFSSLCVALYLLVLFKSKDLQGKYDHLCRPRPFAFERLIADPSKKKGPSMVLYQF